MLYNVINKKTCYINVKVLDSSLNNYYRKLQAF